MSDLICIECGQVYAADNGDADKLVKHHGNRCRCGGEVMPLHRGLAFKQFVATLTALGLPDHTEGIRRFAVRALFDDIRHIGREEGIKHAVEIVSQSVGRDNPLVAAGANSAAVPANGPGPGTPDNGPSPLGDPNRCPCGRVATSSRYTNGVATFRCTDHTFADTFENEA